MPTTHVADQEFPESKLTLPWFGQKRATYINYGCRIECFLDSGMVLHKTLPQSQQQVDTLGTYDLSKPGAEEVAVGENLKSSGNYRDVVQRMATSTYRFLLKGFGVRAGYPIPVPSLKTVAGIVAVPERQWVQGNEVISNFYGIPVFSNAWELWYIVTRPPVSAQTPPPNLALHISADQQLPDEISVPVCPNDYNAVPSRTLAVESSKG